MNPVAWRWPVKDRGIQHFTITQDDAKAKAAIRRGEAVEPLYAHPPHSSIPTVTGAMRDVLAERLRQVEAEGWTPEHDDKHIKGEMGKAAGVYALAASSHDYRWVLRGSPVNDYLAATFKMWPWDWSWFKPKNRRRDLVKAGALILAEIERLDRSTLSEESKP